MGWAANIAPLTVKHMEGTERRVSLPINPVYLIGIEDRTYETERKEPFCIGSAQPLLARNQSLAELSIYGQSHGYSLMQSSRRSTAYEWFTLKLT
jgi:hypothetical protein